MSFSRGKQSLFLSIVGFLFSLFARIFASKKEWMTFSNFLTSLRLILAPCVCIALSLQYWNIASLVFFCAAITDFFDGFFARYFNECTLLGRVLDPIADKMLLIFSVGGLTFFDSPFLKMPMWFFVLVAMRELLLLIGGGFILLKKRTFLIINPSQQGKFATFILLSFLSFSFTFPFTCIDFQQSVNWFLFVFVLFFYIGSFFCYAYQGFFDQKHSKNN